MMDRIDRLQWKTLVAMGVLVLAFGVAAAVTLTSKKSPATASTQQPKRLVAGYRASAATVTVAPGDTLSVTNFGLPSKPSEAADPPAWDNRVLFKGCGQTVSVKMHVGKRLLVYNAGIVTRYIRGSGGVPIIWGVHTVVPRDWRLITFSSTGQRVMTFTTATCTLWSPKIVVQVVP